jgi:hypothetical protein
LRSAPLRRGGRIALAVSLPGIDLDFEGDIERGGRGQRPRPRRVVRWVKGETGPVLERVVDPEDLVAAVDLVLAAADIGEDVVDEQAPEGAVAFVLGIGAPAGDEVVLERPSASARESGFGCCSARCSGGRRRARFYPSRP